MSSVVDEEFYYSQHMPLWGHTRITFGGEKNNNNQEGVGTRLVTRFWKKGREIEREREFWPMSTRGVSRHWLESQLNSPLTVHISFVAQASARAKERERDNGRHGESLRCECVWRQRAAYTGWQCARRRHTKPVSSLAKQNKISIQTSFV